MKRCKVCHAPAADTYKRSGWKMVLTDMAALAAALADASVTLEQVVPGWERTPQWKRMSKALGRYDHWREQVEESNKKEGA